MRLRDAALLGAVQGITEAVPVSSSAHVSALRGALCLGEVARAFDVALHLGSAGAVIATAWPEIVGLIGETIGGVNAWRTRHTRAASEMFPPVNVVLASLPAVLVGACVARRIERGSRHVRVVAGGLTLGSAVMAISEWVAPAPTTRTLHDITWRQSLAIGLAQAVALVPGVSRSGATVAAARMVGLDAETAARFSLLMAAPVMLASAVRGASDLPSLAQTVGLRPLVVGIGAAFAGSLGGFAAVRAGPMRRAVWPWVAYRTVFAGWLLWNRRSRRDG